MAIVVKWAEDGTYLSELRRVYGKPEAVWTTARSRALKFGSQAHARRKVALYFNQEWPVWAPGQVRFVRLIPRKRHAPPQP